MRSASYVTRFAFIVLAFVAGWLIEWRLSHNALSRCQAQNEVLTNDLMHAVGRGVLLETNLTLCKEQNNR